MQGAAASIRTVADVFLKVAAAFVAVAALSGAGTRAQIPEGQRRPRLIVFVVVDQLPNWVYEQARPWFGEGGFRRLEAEGVAFARTAYRHACTFTGPGHATLGTGAVAADHGIVGNSWHDRDSKKTVYCCEDPEAKLLRATATPEVPAGTTGAVPATTPAGRSARQLTAPTLGDTLKIHFGREAKVVALSWKDRSSILLAGHAADVVSWVDDASGRFVSSTAYGDELPPWLVEFDAKEPFAAAFGRTWDRFASAAAYARLEDDRALEAPSPRGVRILPRVIDGGRDTIGPSFFAQVAASPFANEVLVDAAMAAVTGVGLGEDAIPDFLGLSFSANDLVGHACGPDSVEVRDLLLRTDAAIAKLIDWLDEKIGRDAFAFILSSDHGSPPLPAAWIAKRGVGGRGPITRHAAQAANKALTEAFGAPPEGTERWISAMDESSLYLDRAAFAARKIDFVQACETAARGAATAPGIQLAVTLAQAAARASSDSRIYQSLMAAIHPARVGDVLVVNAPYWLDSFLPSTHGTPWPYDQEVPLLMMAPGLKKGFRCHDPVTPGAGVVVAARLLGIPKPALAWDEAPGSVFSDP